MATEPASAVEPGADAAVSAAPACAITRPATPIGITLLAPEALEAAGLPTTVQVEDPAGELQFTVAGQAIYEPVADRSDVISFRYVADYPEGSTGPQTAYVLVNGTEPLPPDAFADPALTAACSRAEALDVKLAAPGAPVPAPEPGVRVEVPVAEFAGTRIELLDAAFGTEVAKYFVVEGGVVVFLKDGRVVFLADADKVDLPQLPQYLLPAEFGDQALWGAAQLLAHAKGVGASQVAPPSERAELHTNHVAFLSSPPAGANTVETVARTELPFCAAEISCRVFEYQGHAYVAISEELTAALGAEAGFATLAAGLGGFGYGAGPALVLAAAGPLETLEVTSAGGDLAAYWLERDPGSSVLRIDGFFAAADQPDPPDLSIAESRFVGADALLRAAQPVVLPGFEASEPVLRIPPSAFPSRLEHGGGAGFTPLGADGLEGRLVPLLEQRPTEQMPDPLTQGPTQRPPLGGNREPIANDDVAATFSGRSIELTPLVNDFDPDAGDVIRLTGRPGLTETAVAVTTAAPALHGLALSEPIPTGSVMRLGPQTIRYTPDLAFEGTATISYVITDGRGGVSAPATITVAVVDGNLAPVARDDTATTPLDTPVVLDVLANDCDRDDLPNLLLPDGEGLPLTIARIVERPEHGTLERVGAGGEQQLRYTPDRGFSGVDSFRYTNSDGLDTSEPATATILVGGGGPVLIAVVDEALAQVGGEAVTIPVLANDIGVDLAIAGLDDPMRGAAAIVGDQVRYQPPAVVAEPGRIVDRFSYAIGDGTVSAEIRVDLNRAPEAVADLRELTGITQTIAVLANDSDIDGDVLTIDDVGATREGGVVEISADRRQIIYTRPDESSDDDQPFSDVFEYTIEDGRGGFASATVRLFEGPDVPPTLTVEPSEVRLQIAREFAFATSAAFPELDEGRRLDDALVDRVDAGDVSLRVSRTVTVSFVSESAGFDNSLGFYRLVDGLPATPELIFPRLDEGRLTDSDPVLLGRFPAGSQIGLFLVQDAADLLDDATELDFRHDGAGRTTLVRIDGGVESEVDAPVFFSDSSLNGGAVLATAGRAGETAGSLRIGFEDRAAGADGDYNDAVVELRYGNVVGSGLELDVAITDPDSATMMRATVTVANAADGDRLLLDGTVGGALPDGITVSGEHTIELSISGAASPADYERLLEAVALEVDALGETRQLVFQVFDDSSPDALPSNIARVTIEPVPVSGSDLLAGLIVGDQVAA